MNYVSYWNSKNTHFPGYAILSKDVVVITLLTFTDIYRVSTETPETTLHSMEDLYLFLNVLSEL